MDMIVVGAGIAGLAAARTLAEKGARVALVEARDRVGGRIYTLPSKTGGLHVELGAEFIHGLPSDLLALVEEAGLTRFELEGDNLCYRGGKLQSCEEQSEIEELFYELGHLKPLAVDLSFEEFAVRRKFSPETLTRARNYVEGFNAADASRISVLALAKQQAAEDAISGDRLFRVVEGYGAVPEFLLRKFLAAGGEYFPSSPVRSITWQPGRVEILAGRVFEASAAVITLPLGVLQARTVQFQPQPGEMLTIADQLVMGPAARVIYEFERRAWPERLSFLFAPDTVPPTWWTAWPKSDSAIITGWVAGRKASKLDLATLPGSGLTALASILGYPVGELSALATGQWCHDWQKDAHALGAYSYVARGGIDASEKLSAPVEDTLFFAGEHTDVSGHWGTVHGALRSGYRAAQQVLKGRS
jgi:monoamine oxidase